MISRKSIMVGFTKAGQLIATAFLFLSFMGILFHGQYVWTEPNMAILTFEIVLSSLWLAASIIETSLIVMKLRKEKGSQ